MTYYRCLFCAQNQRKFYSTSLPPKKNEDLSKYLEKYEKDLREIWKKIQDRFHTPQPTTEWYYKKMNFLLKSYEDFIGLTEVKAAQIKVVENEKRFIDAQNARRDTQALLFELQTKITSIHRELEKTYRGEDRYLALVTEEHTLSKEERNLTENCKSFEIAERDNFATLSNSLRDSHEKERAQAEKTKYWSLLGSILGTIVGVVGTTLNNRMKMKELRSLVIESSASDKSDLQNLRLLKSEMEVILKKMNGGLVQKQEYLPAQDSKAENVLKDFQSVILSKLESSTKYLLKSQSVMEQKLKEILLKEKESHSLLYKYLQGSESNFKSLDKMNKISERMERNNERILCKNSEVLEHVKDIRSLLLSQNDDSLLNGNSKYRSVSKNDFEIETQNRNVYYYACSGVIAVLTPIITFYIYKSI